MNMDEVKVLTRVDTNWKFWNIWFTLDVKLFWVKLSSSNLDEDIFDLLSVRTFFKGHH